MRTSSHTKQNREEASGVARQWEQMCSAFSYSSLPAGALLLHKGKANDDSTKTPARQDHNQALGNHR